MLHKYVVKFQLLLDKHKLDEIRYSSDIEPCSKWRALLNLEVLWGKDYDYFREPDWRESLESALATLKACIQQAEQISARGDNIYKVTFKHANQLAEIKVIVEAGDGHFSHRGVAPLEEDIVGV